MCCEKCKVSCTKHHPIICQPSWDQTFTLRSNIFYQNWGKFHTAAKLLIHNGRQSCEANSPDSFMGDNKEMILTNFLGSIKLELSEVVLGPDFRQGSVVEEDHHWCLTGAGCCLELSMKFHESSYKIWRRLLLGTVPWLAKILKVKALIV